MFASPTLNHEKTFFAKRTPLGTYGVRARLGGWAFNRPTCGRPRPDLKLELMCYIGGRQLDASSEEKDKDPALAAGSFGIDFGDRGDEAFKNCCNPPDALPNSTFLYLNETNCGGMKFCFMNNPWVGNSWTYCVQDAATRLMEELRAESGQEFNYTVEDAIVAECEVVYYDWLRNPMLVRKPNPQKCSVGVLQASWMSKGVFLGVLLATTVFLS
ncbi:hypothetical protein PG985_011391 [Apiospora marii]|uniref:Uncharacterized protein n=1 Tax=Apiospora marii TaxID=335849 RepID=A0ABR1SVV4_9PEZI